jgi:hypothetical protein
MRKTAITVGENNNQLTLVVALSGRCSNWITLQRHATMSACAVIGWG